MPPADVAVLDAPTPSAPVTTTSSSAKTNTSDEDVLLQAASTELEHMRHKTSRSFPPACLALLQSIEGNHRCVDCGEQNPQWAAYRYGALLCLNCSGHHRSLGVQVSSVRSISMDEWSISEVISMLEGGNRQLAAFFQRHQLTAGACGGRLENVTLRRYKTKAALFYRRQMELHVQNILAAGPYRGRQWSRRLPPAAKETTATTTTTTRE